MLIAYETRLHIFLVVIIFALVYCIIYAPSIENLDDNDNSFLGKLNQLHKSCIVSCGGNNGCKSLIKETRGENYFISTPLEKQKTIKNCLVTFWGLTHFILYFAVGYFLPNLLYEAIALGVGFELYEYKVLKCHDSFDIVLNIGGLMLGRYLSPYPRVI